MRETIHAARSILRRRRYRHRPGRHARLCAGRRRAGLRLSRRARPCAGRRSGQDYGGRRVGTNATAYHDPFVLFGFLAGVTQKIGFAAGVLILAQRQAALVAKQAACLDALVRGPLSPRRRRRLERDRVPGAGLRLPHPRQALRGAGALHAGAVGQAARDLQGRVPRADDGGINPRPKSGKVPVWFGGHAEATFQRVAKYGDGFMPNRWPPGDEALRPSTSCAA